jgi:hypothetical protein
MLQKASLKKVEHLNLAIQIAIAIFALLAIAMPWLGCIAAILTVLTVLLTKYISRQKEDVSAQDFLQLKTVSQKTIAESRAMLYQREHRTIEDKEGFVVRLKWMGAIGPISVKMASGRGRIFTEEMLNLANEFGQVLRAAGWQVNDRAGYAETDDAFGIRLRAFAQSKDKVPKHFEGLVYAANRAGFQLRQELVPTEEARGELLLIIGDIPKHV